MSPGPGGPSLKDWRMSRGRSCWGERGQGSPSWRTRGANGRCPKCPGKKGSNSSLREINKQHCEMFGIDCIMEQYNSDICITLSHLFEGIARFSGHIMESKILWDKWFQSKNSFIYYIQYLSTSKQHKYKSFQSNSWSLAPVKILRFQGTKHIVFHQEGI